MSNVLEEIKRELAALKLPWRYSRGVGFVTSDSAHIDVADVFDDHAAGRFIASAPERMAALVEMIEKRDRRIQELEDELTIRTEKV